MAKLNEFEGKRGAVTGNACWCGLLAYAKCTRCGEFVCRNHYDSTNYAYPGKRNHGVGKTLADAAFNRGYWSNSIDRFICTKCRTADGEAHKSSVLRSSRGWRRDPFLFAITAASQGYVIREPGITRAEAVRAWIALGLPPETVKLAPKLPGWQGSRQDPRMVGDHPGWIFPSCVPVSHGRNMHTDEETYSMSGSTIVLADGRVFPKEEELGQYPDLVVHLIVSMARKLFEMRHGRWQGPLIDWNRR